MTNAATLEKSALKQVRDFEREYGSTALHLAYHAALPVALNTALVHFLRLNFFFDPPETLSYNTEADLLLSPLCHEIGNDLYEIEPEVRNLLLQGLVDEYGQERLREVATLLWQYNERYAPWTDRVELERAQQLTALIFLDPLRAKQWLEKTSADTTSVEQHAWFVAMRKDVEQIEDILTAPTEEPKLEQPEEITTSNFKNGYALIIGIANYLKFPRLSDVVLNDARDLPQLLRSPDHCGYFDSNAQLLLDRAATAEGIRAGLRWLAKSTSPESTVFIFFSGHSARVGNGSRASHCLIPYDGDPAHLEQTAISGEELIRLLSAIKTRKLLVIFDCCHSGGTGETKAAEPVETLKVAGKEFKSGLEEQYLSRLAKKTHGVYMTSSRSDEPAYILPGMDNSLFTHYLLEALRGQTSTRGDGLIRVLDVFNYVSEKVLARYPQHPTFCAEINDNFPIALYLGGKAVKTDSSQSDFSSSEGVDQSKLKKPNAPSDEKQEKYRLTIAEIEYSLDVDNLRRTSIDTLIDYERTLLAIIRGVRKTLPIESRQAILNNLRSARDDLSLAIRQLEEKGQNIQFFRYLRSCRDHLEQALEHW